MDNILKNNNLKARYVIVGNSAAGLSCSEGIRQEDKKSKIIILTNEKYKNYSKPLISYLLAGKADLKSIHFKNEDFYKSNKLKLLKNFNVKKIDFKNKEILSGDDRKVIYEKLCIAAGGIPVIPGIEMVILPNGEKPGTYHKDKKLNSDFSERKNKKLSGEEIIKIKGLFTFTTLDDALKIKEYIKVNKAKNAVILGGGLIGIKSAESLLSLNLKINIIEMSDRLLPSSFDKQSSEIYEGAFSEAGSNVFINETVKRIYIKNNKVKAVEIGNKKIISSEILIIAAGVKPNFNFIDKENEAVKIIIGDTGIKTDSHMRTAIPDVFAAGDIAENENILKKSFENIAIWPLAVRQGKVAGKNMAGISIEYSGGFSMNSVEILGIPGIATGITNPENSEEKRLEIISDYSKDKKIYKKIVILENVIIGVLLIGNIERAGIFSGLIANKINVKKIKDLLLRDDFGVIQLPSEYKKHLVTGEAVAL